MKTVNNVPIALGTSITTILLGLVVIVGWFIKSELLIQVLPQFAPMQFNTALGFLMCGVGLAALHFAKPALAVVCSCLLIALGGLTLVQYIFLVDLGIDLLFMDFYILVKTSHPGRMAPNTALCFVLSGAALFLSMRAKADAELEIAARVLAVLTGSLGLVALVGYLSNVETAYGWSSLTRMAVHTSIGFIVVSIGLVANLFSVSLQDSLRGDPPAWLAGAAIFVTICVSAALLFEIENNETRSIRVELEREAQYVENTLEAALSRRFLDLSRLGQRLEDRVGIPERQMQQEAQSYLSNYSDLQAVGRTDKLLNLLWLDTWDDSISNREFTAGLAEQQSALLESATANAPGSVRVPKGYVDGKRAFVGLVPSYRESVFDGYVLGIFDLDDLVLQKLSADWFSKYRVAIFRDDTLIYTSRSEKDAESVHIYEQDTVELYGVVWRIQLSPTDELLATKDTALPELTITGAIALSILILLGYRLTEMAKRHADERHANQAYLETILENIREGVVACDADGNLSYFNKAAARIMGAEIKDVDRADWSTAYNIFGKDGDVPLPSERLPLFRAYEGEVVESEEIVIVSEQSQRTTAIVNALPLHDLRGNKVGGVATLRDVTVERAQAMEVEHQRSELQLIFDNVPVRIWLKDDKNRILRLNKTAADSMGLSVEEAEGADTYDLFPELAKQYHDDDLGVIESGVPTYGIVEEYTPVAGERGWVRTDKVPYTDPATGERLVFVASVDITSLMMAKEELARSNEELEQFARVASHDLQEPIRHLILYSDFLVEDLGDDLSEAAKTDLDTITASARRMQNLIKDVLSLSRVQSEGLKLTEIDAHESISEAMQSVALACQERGAVIAYEDTPLVLADKTLLTQVYQNLATNALKFIPDDRVPRISFTAEVKHSEVILGVKDNGIGIASEHAEKIFKPLVRLHGRSSYDGTGIGLAICKKAIESQGGQIWVESTPDKGSHFKFNLKLARVENLPSPAREAINE